MEELMIEYKEKFKSEPLIIGMFFDNPRELYKNLLMSIRDNKPYNEEDLLSDEKLKSLKEGTLVF